MCPELHVCRVVILRRNIRDWECLRMYPCIGLASVAVPNPMVDDPGL